MYNELCEIRDDEVVVELEIIKKEGRWYRKGLNMKGEECWEEMVEEKCYYGDNWDEFLKGVE